MIELVTEIETHFGVKHNIEHKKYFSRQFWSEFLQRWDKRSIRFQNCKNTTLNRLNNTELVVAMKLYFL